ncbi:RDD family protein [Thermomonas paludicola]|uniref:RDD family protein n=1 Tax=Thermomonas paludicola TaxID=2884874 RepID=UPI00211554A4|nr:RDD family protein [Thermomonas paludicola]
MLDTVREVLTPEGVALRLPAAGPVPRALAWAIDFGIRLSLLTACTMLLGALGKTGMGVYLIALFAVVWLYPIVCEGMFDGQTPGKRALNLRVIASDGAPVGWLASCVRNLMRTVDMLPFGYASGLVSGLADPWGRRLGDLVAGTMVVHVPRVRDAAIITSEAAQPPAQPLLPTEQAAVVAFAERAAQLTPERQIELANLADMATGTHGAEGVQRLFAVAGWLLGKR